MKKYLILIILMASSIEMLSQDKLDSIFIELNTNDMNTNYLWDRQVNITNKHLPDIPSADEVHSNGVEVGDMQARLLKKIEELTLHLIELKKENEEIKKMMKEK